MPRRARQYQLDALQWSDTAEYCGFFVDMRMGKCLIAIRRCNRWHITGPKLIIAPYSAFDSWQENLIAEHEQEAIELVGTPKQRFKKLTNQDMLQSSWYIINKEGFKSLPEIASFNWSVLIADESRFLKNPKSNQSKFFTKQFKHIKHKIILTGTPDYNNKIDYYQQLYFLNPTILPWTNYWDFRNKAFHQVGYDFVMTKKAKEVFDKVLAKHCYFLRRKDVNLGRKKVYKKRVLTLPRKLRPVYRTLEDEYILGYKEDISKTIYAVETYTWMMRICGGSINNRLEWPGKIKEVIYLLENELQKEQVVIICRFKEEIKYLLYAINSNKELNKAGVIATGIHGDMSQKKRRINLTEFRVGKYKILIASSVIQHGIDLKNASTIIFYSQVPGGEARDQIEDRIITMSDEKTVLIIDILVKNTIDMDSRQAHLIGESSRQRFERTIKRRQKCLV